MSKQEIRVEKAQNVPYIKVVDGAPYLQAARAAILDELAFYRGLPISTKVEAITRLIKKNRDTFAVFSPRQVLSIIIQDDEELTVSDADGDKYSRQIAIAMDGWLFTTFSPLLMRFGQK